MNLAFALALLLAQERELSIEHFVGHHDALWKPRASDATRVALGGVLVDGRSDAFLSELMDLAGLDAVAIGYRDLAAASRFSKLHEGRFVCANVTDASTGKPIARPFVVKKVGDLRVAFVGVTQPPSYLSVDLKGWKIEDPAQALSRLLPEIRKSADRVLILAVMDRIECGKIVGGETALVPAFGTSDPEPLAVGAGWLVQSFPDAMGRLVLRWDGKRVVRAVNTIEVVELTDEERSREETFLAKHGQKRGEPRFVADELPRKEEGVPRAISLEDGQSQRIGMVRSNRAAELTLHSVQARAEKGKRKLILDTEWKNVIPMSFVFDRQVPVAYQVPKLEDHLYLVVNGRTLSRLDVGLSSGAGGLLEKGLELPRRGSSLRGSLAFPIPEGTVESLEVRFYDYAHGLMVLPLMEKQGKAEKLPVPMRNEILELNVVAVRHAKGWEGRTAPEGMTFMIADIRARSRFTQEVDATAFDPKAESVSKTEAGTVADWKEATKYIYAVLDGEYAYAPTSGGTLPSDPRFLPDVMTGGEVAFLVPEKCVSREIRFDILHAQPPGGEEIQPQPIVWTLQGARPDPPEREPIVEIEDGTLHVSVVGQSVVREFAGVKVAEKKKFLVLDVLVTSTETGGDFFQTKEQLKYATEKGAQLAFHSATLKGFRYPGDPMWIPTGERRVFQVVFEIPESDKKLRLAYAGITKAETVDLKSDE